jgi:hypothetical protein
MKSTHITTSTTQANLKRRKQLNELQLELLIALYKFRLGTAELLSQYQEQSLRYTNVRLKILLEQKYVGRNYDSSYRIARRPATYYLLPNGIQALKTNPDLDPKGLHLQYYNRKVKPAFISHSIRLFRLYLKLDSLYGETLDFFTASELTADKQYPRPLPDSFLSFSGKQAAILDCMLELIESTTPPDRVRQRLNRFMTHEQLKTWDGAYPVILLVCDNVGLEREMQRYMTRTMDYRGSRLRCYTTTLRAILSSKSVKDTVWTDVTRPDEIVALSSIL